MTGPEDLDLRWRSLSRPTGDRIAAERIRSWAGGPVLAAVDAAGLRHLLVKVADNTTLSQMRPVAGLHVQLTALRPPGQDQALWLNLAPAEPGDTRPFTSLCADIVADLPDTGPDDTSAPLAILDRWRRFWAARWDGLSREEQIGLAGELLVLLEWIPTITTATLTAWHGPLGGRHDWVGHSLAVEVKTTAISTGPVIHRISRLDQLEEPSDRPLYLLSQRLVADPAGELSLDRMIRRARMAAAATDRICETLLDDRLRARGVTRADDGRYSDPLRLADRALYKIDENFPRLVPATFPTGLPAGIIDVTYALDTSACSRWLIARHPTETDILGRLSRSE